MPAQTVENVWPQLTDEIVEILGTREKDGKAQNRLQDLYRICVGTNLPANIRAPAADADSLKALHNLVLQAVRQFQHGWPSIKRADVRRLLEKDQVADAGLEALLVDQAINIALCLWLGLDCAIERHVGARLWPESDTIEHFVLRRRFDVSTEADAEDFIKYFPPKFRAARLDEISGIKVEQTYYLDQHLRFNEDLRTVRIFMDFAWLQAMIAHFQADMEHPEASDRASFRDGEQDDINAPKDVGVGGDAQAQMSNYAKGLEAQAKEPTAKISDVMNRSMAKALLPIFEESLRTLDVLFPDWDGRTITFVDNFRENGKKIPWFDLNDLTPQVQQGLHKFKYWRARLTQLIIEHQSPPRDWKHIWNDRRNPMAFWTFWIGMAIFLLTFIFGTIASVLAGLTLARPGG